MDDGNRMSRKRRQSLSLALLYNFIRVYRKKLCFNTSEPV